LKQNFSFAIIPHNMKDNEYRLCGGRLWEKVPIRILLRNFTIMMTIVVVPPGGCGKLMNLVENDTNKKLS
jgi:hypothetical protein